MRHIVNDQALDILFRTAGDRHVWLARPVSDTILHALWELVRHGPSSGACTPPRVVFVRSEEARARLDAALSEPDRAKLTAAPAAAIVACPAAHGDDAEPVHPTALREGTLHAAYLMLAGRALGLDCAPIWEFDAALVEREFFPDGEMAASFLCALGYGQDGEAVSADPRPAFAEACAIL